MTKEEFIKFVANRPKSDKKIDDLIWCWNEALEFAVIQASVNANPKEILKLKITK